MKEDRRLRLVTLVAPNARRMNRKVRREEIRGKDRGEHILDLHILPPRQAGDVYQAVLKFVGAAKSAAKAVSG